MASPMRLRDLPDALNAVSGEVLDAAIEVHRALGPGLLESAYENCLAHELSLRGRSVRGQVPLTLAYKGLEVPHAYRLDLLVDDCVVVEIKCVTEFTPEHEAQLFTYLRLSGKRLGILLNFHAALMREGFLRRAL